MPPTQRTRLHAHSLNHRARNFLLKSHHPIHLPLLHSTQYTIITIYYPSISLRGVLHTSSRSAVSPRSTTIPRTSTLHTTHQQTKDLNFTYVVVIHPFQFHATEARRERTEDLTNRKSSDGVHYFPVLMLHALKMVEPPRVIVERRWSA